MVGSSPTITNSVVPIAKALSVNARSAKGIIFTLCCLKMTSNSRCIGRYAVALLIDGGHFALKMFCEK
jgi:hypothetical protein